MAEAGEVRFLSHPAVVGLLGICATMVLGVGSWVLVTVIDLRDRVHVIEVTRPLYEQRLEAVEAFERAYSRDGAAERPPGWRDDPHGGAN